MVPYQVYEVLAHQRVHDRVATAHRRAQLAAATRDSSDAYKLSARVKDVAKRMLAAFHAGREASGSAASDPTRAGAGAPSNMTTGAGPIGCSA